MSKALQLALFTSLFLGLGVLYYLHFSRQKVVYVDSVRLANNYQGMIDARQEYQEKTLVWKANIDTLSKEVQKVIQDHEKENDRLTTKEKELSRELIRTKRQQLRDYQKAMNDKAAQEDHLVTTRLLAEMNAYIKRYGEANNCRIIIAATEYGNVAYAAKGLDITDDILHGLNEEYAGH